MRNFLKYKGICKQHSDRIRKFYPKFIIIVKIVRANEYFLVLTNSIYWT